MEKLRLVSRGFFCFVFIMHTDQIAIVYGSQGCSISVLSSEYQQHNNSFAKSITLLPFLISEGLVDLNTL